MNKTVTYVVGGALTGAGLGTVFGAALILFLGKDFFGTGDASHDFLAHTNFMLGIMLFFAVVVAIVTYISLMNQTKSENS
jgi:hypothetical protein